MMVRATRQTGAAPAAVTQRTIALPLAGLRILVADDDRIPRRIVASAVAAAGGEPIEAEDGADVLSLWAAGAVGRAAFDAAVLDFVMPGLDGADVIRTLRELGFRGAAVGLTAAASEAEIRAWIAAGCDLVLTKGCSQTSIVERIVEALAQRRARNIAE